MLRLPTLSAAFSFILASGESDAFFMNRRGVRRSPSSCCGTTVSVGSGLPEANAGADEIRIRTGVVTLVSA